VTEPLTIVGLGGSLARTSRSLAALRIALDGAERGERHGQHEDGGGPGEQRQVKRIVVARETRTSGRAVSLTRKRDLQALLQVHILGLELVKLR
jgi:hypothetical protein